LLGYGFKVCRSDWASRGPPPVTLHGVFAGLENPIHLLFLALVVLLLFGPKRLPEIGRSLGSGIRELRGSLSEHGSADSEDKLGN
jgi:TatA/E family protein of Tat protein translocase